MALYTTLPIEEVTRLGELKDPEINRAKEVLAYEVTALTHGSDAAKEIYLAVTEQFGCADPENSIPITSAIAHIKPQQNQANLPTFIFKNTDFKEGVWIVKLLMEAGLANSNGAARRLIQSGGAYLNSRRIEDVNDKVELSDFVDGQLLLRSGKKNLRRIITR